MMTARARLRLPSSRRLKLQRDFARVRSKGQRVPSGCLIANWQVLPPGSPNRIGVVTAKKIGNAVERSRARRLLKEVFRLHQHDFERPVDLVLVARQSIAGRTYAEVERDFLRALRQGNMLKRH